VLDKLVLDKLVLDKTKPLLPLIGGSNGVLLQVLGASSGRAAQAFGRLPWFAELPLRDRRLRPRLLMVFLLRLRLLPS
jgi:hypothetical protein